MAYWEDPEFNAEERAFYYVRVLEIPTPRWTTYDAAFYGVDCRTVFLLISRNAPIRRRSGTPHKN